MTNELRPDEIQYSWDSRSHQHYHRNKATFGETLCGLMKLYSSEDLKDVPECLKPCRTCFPRPKTP